MCACPPPVLPVAARGREKNPPSAPLLRSSKAWPAWKGIGSWSMIVFWRQSKQQRGSGKSIGCTSAAPDLPRTNSSDAINVSRGVLLTHTRRVTTSCSLHWLPMRKRRNRLTSIVSMVKKEQLTTSLNHTVTQQSYMDEIVNGGWKLCICDSGRA